MKRRADYFLAVFGAILILFLAAYLTHISWLWIIAVGTLVVTVIMILRHFANSILEENNENREGGRMFILPRPSGLGSQARPGMTFGAGPNVLTVKQEKEKDEQVGETHAFFPESAWASTSHHKDKGDKEVGS